MFAVSNAMAADLAPPPPLGPVVSGAIDNWYGFSILTGEGDNVNPGTDWNFITGLVGKLSIPLGSNLTIQQDVGFQYGTNAESNNQKDFRDTFLYSGQMGTHLSLRNVDQGLIGAFGGIGAANGNDTKANYAFAGGEGMLWTGPWTLYGQGGWFSSEETNNAPWDSALHDAFFVRGVARYFLTPDSRLQGEFSYANGKYGYYDDTANIFEWHARYDFVWNDVPVVGSLVGAIPLYLEYRGNYADGAHGDALWDNAFMVGTSYHFGGNNKQEFDKVGATLDLPDIGRWVAAGSILDINSAPVYVTAPVQ